LKKVLLQMGTPSFDAILVKEIITDFKRRRNVVSRVTTRSGLGKTVEQRVASVSLYKLELASLNDGQIHPGFQGPEFFKGTGQTSFLNQGNPNLSARRLFLKSSVIVVKLAGNLTLRQKNQRPSPKPNLLELQIDSSDSQLPFYEEVPDQDFGASLDHSTV